MFSSITEPRFPNAGLGIEAGMLTAVTLAGKKRDLSIKQAGSVELPAGLLNPSFLDTNITDYQEFAACLREVTEVAGLMKQKRWSVSLPSNSARTAILALENEPSSGKEADEVLDWKAEQTFGVPAAELRLARKKISPDADGRARYFVTAVRLAVVDEYETHFEALGWKAGLILPRAVGEANWLIDRKEHTDSLLISGHDDGFTALLLQGTEPTVVRSVTCDPQEVDDEIYRLVMFYGDRFGSADGARMLDRLMVVGRSLIPSKIQMIASDALGHSLHVLSSEDLGLRLPSSSFSFDDLAAPAGLAALGS